MVLNFALRDEKVNIFAMTLGNESYRASHQIMLCKKNAIPENRFGPYLLDAKKSSPNFALSPVGKEYRNSLEEIDIELNHIAFIDSQIKIIPRMGLFNALCNEGYFSIWDPAAPMSYFGELQEVYLVLFRVYKISESINESLLYHGRKGRNFYYKLDKEVEFNVIKPVIEDSNFKRLKDGLLEIIKSEGALLDINEGYNETIPFLSVGDEEDIINKIGQMAISNEPIAEYKPKPKIKKALLEEIGGKLKYPRSIEVATNSIKRASFQCEVNETHKTFIRKRDNKPYTEPHHLIPLSNHYKFINDLDVEANVVSLCSHCHNQLHYGAEFEEILLSLYNKRKGELEAAGIGIDFFSLLGFYK